MSESKHCILVVDSEALVRWSLHQRLSERGYRVLQASTARAALQLAGQADLVLMERLEQTGARVYEEYLGTVSRWQALQAWLAQPAVAAPARRA